VVGQFFAADGSGVFNTPSTSAPLLTQTFPGIEFNAVAGGVTQQTRPFTDVVTDPSGLFAGSIPAQGNGYQAGVGGLQNFSAVFTGSLNVPAAGPVTFGFTADDAFVFGVGGGATRVSGPQMRIPSHENYHSELMKIIVPR